LTRNAESATLALRRSPVNGDEFRRVRERLGLTREQFAEELILNPDTVGKIERGELPVSARMERLVQTLLPTGARQLANPGSSETFVSPDDPRIRVTLPKVDRPELNIARVALEQSGYRLEVADGKRKKRS
jgi:transcriptional regulator with XRE-family HTH domain